MATRQYIGARYVPKFFSGEGGSTEWINTVQYEPLTIVTYLGNSYTSKKPVPVGIDISNTEYWASTGLWNSQVEQYREEVEAYKETVDDLSDEVDLLKYYVTPEMYGAKADGSVDDALGINLALRSGYPVVLKNVNYQTETPIDVRNDNIIIDRGSTITYSGTDSAVLLQGNGGYDVSFGNIISNDRGIEFVGETQNSIIRFKRLNCASHCIYYNPSSESFVYYTSIIGGQCNSTNGDCVHIEMSTYGDFNENRFYNIRMVEGTYGVYITKSSGYCDRLYFENIGLEVPDNGFYLDGIWDSVINGVRTEEVYTNNANYKIFNIKHARNIYITGVGLFVATAITYDSTTWGCIIDDDIFNTGFASIGSKMIIKNGKPCIELRGDNIEQVNGATFTAPTPATSAYSYIPRYYIFAQSCTITLDSDWYGFDKINDIFFYNNTDSNITLTINGPETQSITITARKGLTRHWGETYGLST